MKTLDTSLRCLVHPATLSCVLLLLLNDHVLKAAAPSWITGKLSDFAGLFFFPFLLAALLSVVLDRVRFPVAGAGMLAIGVTGVAFTLIKTTSWANTQILEFLSNGLGIPSQILLDPTDLIALPVLLLTWRLWNRQEYSAPSPAGWAMLAIAALASAATTPPPPPARVVRLVQSDNAIIATYVDGFGVRKEAMSTDAGAHWAANTMDRISTGTTGDSVLPIIKCLSTTLSICYRITGQEQVDRSTDGGETFSTAWMRPVGRDAYMKRVGTISALDLHTFDMIILEQAGQLEVMVALGNEGLLIGEQDGKWERVPFLNSAPPPYYAEDPYSAMLVMLAEGVKLATIAFFAGGVLGILGWWVFCLVMFRRGSLRQGWRWLVGPMAGTVLAGVVGVMLFRSISPLTMQGLGIIGGIVEVLAVWLLYLAIPVPVLGVVWVLMGRMACQPKMLVRATIWLIVTVLVMLLAWIPFLSWATGEILVYETALAIAGAVLLVSLICGAFGVVRYTALAATESSGPGHIASS
jgi:hypothetical protein